jgi:hypothetical protein
MKKRFSLYAICLALVSFSTYAQENRVLTEQISTDTAVYAMMASNAYANDKEKLYFPLRQLGWKKVGLSGSEISDSVNSYTPKTFVGDFFSNLQFDIWENGSSNTTVFAFKGTMEPIDWPTGNLMIGVSIPYKSAKKHVREYMAANPNKRVIVTGHSLGGGLALSVSVWQGVDAIVFNTSPRIFDGAPNRDKPAQRLTIFQQNDILQEIRKHYPKFLKTIKPSQIVETKFDYAGGNTHRIDLLAKGLLACSTSSELAEFAKKLTLNVPCYLP